MSRYWLPVVGVSKAEKQLEGAGFVVRRSFPSSFLPDADPFLLLDHMGPSTYGPGEAMGAPDHPHRGFETVTYLLQGAMEHKDSKGHSSTLLPGGVQWMTAASGIIHSEMPSRDIRRMGGTLEGLQLWVNLRASDKWHSPRYQDYTEKKIPKWCQKGVKVIVIAGDLKVVKEDQEGPSKLNNSEIVNETILIHLKAKIETKTPIVYHHIILEPGANHSWRLEWPDALVFIYILSGTGLFGSTRKRATAGECLVFDTTSHQSYKRIVWMEQCDSNDETRTPVSFILLAGVPLHEPIARRGPFVMNTDAELKQAFDDYSKGKMGTIKAKVDH